MPGTFRHDTRNPESPCERHTHRLVLMAVPVLGTLLVNGALPAGRARIRIPSDDLGGA
jgi:hypothetical protein